MFLLLSLSCAAHRPVPPAADVVPPPAAVENDPRWHPALTAFAGLHRSWGTVDDVFRWAPGLCAAPSQPGAWRFTESADDRTHGGQKVYLLYALDPVAYGFPASEQPPAVPSDLASVRQVLVKESYRAVPAAGDPLDRTPATRDGREFVAGDPLDLYVMMKVGDPSTEGTDAGWVYGTVAPDGTITSAGSVSSCRSCHVDAPHDRWFGLKP